jgi:hypothetical protein
MQRQCYSSLGMLIWVHHMRSNIDLQKNAQSHSADAQNDPMIAYLHNPWTKKCKGTDPAMDAGRLYKEFRELMLQVNFNLGLQGNATWTFGAVTDIWPYLGTGTAKPAASLMP